jgi:uncharacterized protein YndB with AHSA1/START domain
VGPAQLPGHGDCARPTIRRSGGVLHDRPEGDQPRGYWEILEADAPRLLVFRNGFADADGRPNSDMPLTQVRVMITEGGGGQTRMSIESIFPDIAAMEQLLAIGMEQGVTEAVGQIDAILAEDVTSTTGR